MIISMSTNVWDTKVSILFSLLLARASISSSFFFLFIVILSNYFIISVVREKFKVKLALTIPTGAPIKVVKEIIDTPPLVAEKTITILSMESNVAIYLLIFHCLTFFL